MALCARNPSPRGLATLNPQSNVTRTSARSQTCARGPGGVPACHGDESTRNDPQPEKMPKGQKNTFIRKYKVPIREVARGVPQERNEKHPAWNEYHYAGNKSRIRIVYLYQVRTNTSLHKRTLHFRTGWYFFLCLYLETNSLELRNNIGYSVQYYIVEAGS